MRDLFCIWYWIVTSIWTTINIVEKCMTYMKSQTSLKKGKRKDPSAAGQLSDGPSSNEQSKEL